MRNLAMLVAGAMLGAAVLMLVAQPAVEEPATEAPTIHTSYRPVIAAGKNAPEESIRSPETKLVGSWKHEISNVGLMGKNAWKYKDVRMTGFLDLYTNGTFDDYTRFAYTPNFIYGSPYGMTFVHSGKWQVDPKNEKLVLNFSRVDLLKTEGRMTKKSAKSECSQMKRRRTMTIKYLSRSNMVLDDGELRYEYQRSPEK